MKFNKKITAIPARRLTLYFMKDMKKNIMNSDEEINFLALSFSFSYLSLSAGNSFSIINSHNFTGCGCET